MSDTAALELCPICGVRTFSYRPTETKPTWVIGSCETCGIETMPCRDRRAVDEVFRWVRIRAKRTASVSGLEIFAALAEGQRQKSPTGRPCAGAVRDGDGWRRCGTEVFSVEGCDGDFVALCQECAERMSRAPESVETK